MFNTRTLSVLLHALQLYDCFLSLAVANNPHFPQKYAKKLSLAFNNLSFSRLVAPCDNIQSLYIYPNRRPPPFILPFSG